MAQDRCNNSHSNITQRTMTALNSIIKGLIMKTPVIHIIHSYNNNNNSHNIFQLQTPVILVNGTFTMVIQTKAGSGSRQQHYSRSRQGKVVIVRKILQINNSLKRNEIMSD